jgi:basic amino acid/polyamine antiporter, APA family
MTTAAPLGTGTPAIPASDQLPRRLGFWATTAVVVGTIIGSGIFRVPATVAAEVGSPVAIMLVWILGGVISLCGALALAELAAALPQSGGVFVYLRQAYGPLVAFVFGWTQLFLAPASLGGIALVFAEYFGSIVSLSPAGVRTVAALLILLVGIAGYRSVTGLGGFISVASAAKVATIATLVLAAFFLGDGDAGSLGRGAPAPDEVRWGGMGLALVAALWAYTGFNDMVSVAGEVKDPGRVLPRALLVGTAIVVAVYLAANAAYLFVLPFETLKDSPLVASDTMVRVLGSTGAAAVAVMVMVSTLGAICGLGLAVPRIYYAMAREGLLFESLARVHPRFLTPHVAVAFYTVFALVCVWWRSFEQLTEAFVLGTWPFLALAAAGVIVLRRTQPSLPRPYRTPGYPAVPIIFIVATLWVVGSALIARPVTTLAGIGMTLLGVPVYLIWRGATRRTGR